MNKNMHENNEPFQTLIEQASDTLNADVVLMNASFERGIDNRFIDGIRTNKQKQNLLLILVTPGGDADVAYRIARYAQDNYKKFFIFVSGYCKSAGTLCALGAHEIIMCDQGELGPLDVQFYKKDDLGELDSGLVLVEALQTLQQKAFDLFEHHLMEIKRKSGGQISFKLATEIATKMTVGLFEPIYRQIDPVMIGNIIRSMTIAKDYGTRLRLISQNFTEQALDMLVDLYPSHGFVIDRREAKMLFRNIRAPSEAEDNLAKVLGMNSRIPCVGDPILEFLSYRQPDQEAGHEKENSAKQTSGVQSRDEGEQGGANDNRSSRSAEPPKRALSEKGGKLVN